MEWAVFDGTPDETIDVEDQAWALSRLEEYIYRTHFHLSKQDMASEPLEDIVVNMKLMNLAAKKERQETKILEEKSRRGVR